MKYLNKVSYQGDSEKGDLFEESKENPSLEDWQLVLKEIKNKMQRNIRYAKKLREALEWQQ